MYALIVDGVIVDSNLSLNTWRSDNPQVSLPLTPTEEQLNELGIYSVALTPAPPADHTVDLHWDAVLTEDGTCQQEWVVTPASPQEIADRTESQALRVREERNRRLADSDWTQLPDAPVVAADWATYRQALRDVTAQESFPWEVVWPEDP